MSNYIYVTAAAHRAVNEIIRDILDRTGLQEAWESIDEDTRLDIELNWATIISKETKK